MEKEIRTTPECPNCHIELRRLSGTTISSLDLEFRAFSSGGEFPVEWVKLWICPKCRIVFAFSGHDYK